MGASGSANSHLGQNVRAIREARGLSQQQMATAAGIPRATWSLLESGSANPTLAVLVKVAAALQVRLEELLGPPRNATQHVRAADLPSRTKSAVTVRKLLPEPLPGLDIERMVLPPRASMVGVPHTPGTREYLTLERGAIELGVHGEVFVLAPGDVVVFRGDQRHGYRNPGPKEAVAYSVIAFAPSGT
ncbi:MAG: helix-turn-helix transcriptional regulator [Myxococcales bacterium]|nr:helix-turn-helix transcriptional regulator [Myxococcales bacterium]